MLVLKYKVTTSLSTCFGDSCCGVKRSVREVHAAEDVPAGAVVVPRVADQDSAVANHADQLVLLNVQRMVSNPWVPITSLSNHCPLASNSLHSAGACSWLGKFFSDMPGTTYLFKG